MNLRKASPLLFALLMQHYPFPVKVSFDIILDDSSSCFGSASIFIYLISGNDLIRGWNRKGTNVAQEGYGTAAVLPELGIYLAASIYRPVVQVLYASNLLIWCHILSMVVGSLTKIVNVTVYK